MTKLLLIFVGGGCGSVLRYLAGGWAQRLTTGPFPAGTFTVNIIGCLLIGFLTPVLTGHYLMREEYRMAILVGLLGGFTTFSTFGMETVSLAGDQQWRLAALNVLLSNAVGLAAAWLGTRTATAIYGV